MLDYLKFTFSIWYWRFIRFWKNLWPKKQEKRVGPFPEETSVISVINKEEYKQLYVASQSEGKIYMPRVIFDGIIHSLPKNYVIPSQEALETIDAASSNHYELTPLEESRESESQSRADDISTQQLYVKIRENLPKNYKFPHELSNKVFSVASKSVKVNN